MSSTNRTALPTSHSERTRLRSKTIGLFALTAAIALLTVAPLAWMLSSAFKDPASAFTSELIPNHPTLANFIYVFTQAPFALYLFNSFFVAGTVTVIALFFHSMAGYALARLNFPGRDIIFLGIFATLLVSLPVIIVPLFLLVKFFGMINSYAGLIIPSIFNAFGIFLLRQFYLGTPKELEEAAIMDGCGYWRVYWHIMLPLARPTLAALAVFFFLANWNDFLWPLTITTNPQLWVVQVGISAFSGQHGNAWSYVMAASTIAALPTVTLFLVFQRQLVESIKTSGSK